MRTSQNGLANMATPCKRKTGTLAPHCHLLDNCCNSYIALQGRGLERCPGGCRRPGTHLAENQQTLLLLLTGGQGGKLLQLQRRWRRGDVQVVLEGLEDGAGREAVLVCPVTDHSYGGTMDMRGGWGEESLSSKGLGPSQEGQICSWGR